MKLNWNTSFGGSGLTGAGWTPGFWINSTFYPVENISQLDEYLAAVKKAIVCNGIEQ
jgi:hypothetical protein